MSDTPATFGERVRQVREDHGLTRAELAALINATPGAVYSWERNRTYPNHHVYPRLATALQCTVDFLMTGRSS